MRRLSALIIAVLLCACGGRRSREPQVVAPDGGSPSTRDAAARNDGAVEATDGGDTGADATVPPVDGGGSICGPGGTSECGPSECHDVPACVTADLERFGWDDYVECGMGAFTPADSQMACEIGPPFGDWPIAFRCGEASFQGTLRYFCSPTGSEVIVRYQVEGTMPPATGTGLYTSVGTDYWYGSGGGSGEGYLHIDEMELSTGRIHFVGYHPAEIPETGSMTLTMWFVVQPYVGSGMPERFIGGGFQVTIDSTGPAP